MAQLWLRLCGAVLLIPNFFFAPRRFCATGI
jgi:hypothetical protein